LSVCRESWASSSSVAISCCTPPAQLVGYLDALGLEEGWMAVFDEDMAKSWDEKIYNRDISLSGKTLHIVGL